MELPFHFSRFGDGEWNCIFGAQGHNCDKHEYFPDLGARLKQIIESRPKYMVGIQELALRGEHGAEIVNLTDQLKIDWFNADVLHKMSIYGRLGPFMNAIRRRRKIIVGPIYLMSIALGVKYHIPIEEKNCWLEYGAVKEILSYTVKPGDLVLLCAGMMSNVLVDDFKDHPVTMMDVGSLLDPYAGKFTRAYHKTLELN